MRVHLGVSALLLASLLAPARPGATSSPAEGVAPRLVKVDRARFEDPISVEGERFRLNGAGLFRWKYFVKVYAAALYVPEGRTFDLAADVPRRLEIAYFVELGRAGFGKAAKEILARGFPEETLAPLRERMDRLHAAYVDIEPGDRYTLTYLPGRGTELAHNGRPLVVIEGEDFARVYFSIWLGREPIDDGLRDALLGA